MFIKNVIKISSLLYLIAIFGNVSDVTCFSDFENLSYGRDVLYGGAPAYSVTPTPTIEVTTKKSGFFSGIKNLFSRSSTEAPQEATSTTVVPVVTPKSSVPVQPPLSPKGQNPTGSQSSSLLTSGQNIATGSQSSSRDYVNPNVKPGVNPVRPPNENPLGGGINGPTGQSQQSSRHGYVNPNVGSLSGDAGVPVRPPIAGPILQPGSNPSMTPSTPTTPSNKRDYIAPIRPPLPNSGGGTNIPQGIATSTQSSVIQPTQPSSRRDYVNPNVPTPKSPTQFIPPTSNPAIHAPNAGGRRDYVNPNIGGQINPINTNNFPGLSTPKTPPPKEDFPPLPPPRKPPGQPNLNPSSPGPNSAWSKPGGQQNQNRVSFVPHQPEPGSTGNNLGGSESAKNQIASDDEISTLTENLLSKDTNNQNKHITLNLQGKTRSTERTDEAPNKLMELNEVALESPTIAKMRLLFNNYELDTLVNEYVTPIERKEENDFLDAVMVTTVMRQAMTFLQNKGLVTPDPKTHRDLLKTIWFTMYSRGQGRIGSSAFEHVFLTEVKNGTVIGLHNWVYFYEKEKSGQIDYKGYIKKTDLGNKGSILKYRFDLNNIQKPVNTLFVGTSPELELALYTVCFQLRPDKDCPISLNGNKINIVTHTWRYRGKSLIGSAFPEI